VSSLAAIELEALRLPVAIESRPAWALCTEWLNWSGETTSPFAMLSRIFTATWMAPWREAKTVRSAARSQPSVQSKATRSITRVRRVARRRTPAGRKGTSG
jgi:hypothetical protein